MQDREVLKELFNAALDRPLDSEESLIDESTVRPKSIRIAEGADRMEAYLRESGLTIQGLYDRDPEK